MTIIKPQIQTKKVSRHKKEKINVYAKNMRYMDSNLKGLLSDLSNSLHENQWLKVSKDKYTPINHIDKSLHKIKSSSSFKPIGSYYSKGGWIFHEDMCCNLDYEIILIEVDYNTIYRITGKEPFKSPEKNTIYKNSLETFIDKYGVLFGKNKCVARYVEDNKKTKNKNICKTIKNKEECNALSDECLGWMGNIKFLIGVNYIINMMVLLYIRIQKINY